MNTLKIRILALPMLLLFVGCGPSAADIVAELKKDQQRLKDSLKAIKNTTSTEAKNKEEVNTGSEKATLPWNYYGTINNLKIKALINYGESTHAEGSGAVRIPISGYYFYESQNQKIPLEGTATGIGSISLVARTNGGNEYFEGQFINDEMLQDFSGVWSKGGQELKFKLYSR